jgi:hypothetical protein
MQHAAAITFRSLVAVLEILNLEFRVGVELEVELGLRRQERNDWRLINGFN